MNNKLAAMPHSAAKSHLGLYIFVSLACEVVLLTIFLCAFASILCKVDVPLYLLQPFSTALCCAAVLFGAMVFSRLYGKYGLFFGAIFGIFLFLILWVVSGIQGETIFTAYAGIKCISLILSGAIGGYIGVILCEKKRKIR